MPRTLGSLFVPARVKCAVIPLGDESVNHRRIRVLLLLALCLLWTINARAEPGKMITTKSGLQYQVIAEGTGPRAEAGNQVRIHETTTLKEVVAEQALEIRLLKKSMIGDGEDDA